LLNLHHRPKRLHKYGLLDGQKKNNSFLYRNEFSRIVFYVRMCRSCRRTAVKRFKKAPEIRYFLLSRYHDLKQMFFNSGIKRPAAACLWRATDALRLNRPLASYQFACVQK
jgi:hypothetical protein